MQYKTLGHTGQQCLEENVAATNIQLSQEDMTTINEILDKYPDTGVRYGEGALKLVNH